MDPNKMVSFDLRNLSILVKRYIEKEKKDDRCRFEDSQGKSKHEGHDSGDKQPHGHHDGCHGPHHHKHNEATHMQMLVLDYLITNKESDIYQRDIEKQFSIRRPTATNMLKKMEEHGLIKRVPVPDDARLKKIMLTDKSKKLSADLDKKATKLESKLTKGFTKEERAMLSLLMKKMIDNMEE